MSLAIGVNTEGSKEVLGLWLEETEGAKFWLKILTEIKNRGVADILILCCDGLKGFPEAIEGLKSIGESGAPAASGVAAPGACLLTPERPRCGDSSRLGSGGHVGLGYSG